jgi:hypothetical protein
MALIDTRAASDDRATMTEQGYQQVNEATAFAE